MLPIPESTDKLLSDLVADMRKLDDERRVHCINVLRAFYCGSCGTIIPSGERGCQCENDE